MYFFTSITANYISKARILVQSLKKHNPNCVFILGLADNLPENIDLKDELFDDIIYADSLNCLGNINNFFFKYNVVEICTAVKPTMALEIMDKFNTDKVCYLDPDIAVFSELNELDELLDSYSMIFTPHTTVPEEKDYFITGNEVLFLKRGTNNLGFFAVKNDDEGRKFLNWWNSRLTKYCSDDNDETMVILKEHGYLGLFTDQKWIDMVPSFFDNYYILKHPGYNVSTWNLSHRKIKKAEDGSYLVNEVPLKFFHFSGVDSGAHRAVLDHLIVFYPHAKSVLPISDWYLNEDNKNGLQDLKKKEWKYARYSNGEKIPNAHRKLFLLRRDVHDYFKNPFEVFDGECYCNWVAGEYGPRLPMLVSYNTETEKPVVVIPKTNKLVQILHRFLLFFVTPESKSYFRLKKVWKAFK